MKFKNRFFRLISVITVSTLVFASVAVNATTFKSIKKNYDFHYGVDVSSHNKKLDFEAIKSEGIEFMYIRLGFYKEDGGHLDTRFIENLKGCVENGIEFGVYVYSYVYDAEDLNDCAEWINEQLEATGNYCKDKDTIQVSYDVEDQAQKDALSKGEITKKKLNTNIKNFCKKIKNYGYIPVVFSYPSYFQSYLDINGFQKEDVKIWYSQWPYTDSLNTTVKKRMFNSTYADIWQFSSSLTVNGKVTDTNVCYKDFYDYSKEDSKLTVKGLKKTYEYTGSRIKPELKIYDDETLLKKGSDYKLFYYKNKKLGRATVKIVRYDTEGNYLETKTVRFIIKPAAVSLNASANDSKIKLSWNKSYGATKYVIYKNTGMEYKKLASTTNTTYIIDKLKEGKRYSYSVRSYGVVRNKGYYSGYSDVEVYTKYKKPEIKKAKSDTEGTATVKWTPRTSKAKGYVIQYSKNKKFTNPKKITVEGIEKKKVKIDNLKSGKTYYFRIRSYNIKDYKRLYSVYSDVLSATIK